MATAVAITVGVRAGKQSRILIRCTRRPLEEKNTNPAADKVDQTLGCLPVYQMRIIEEGGTEHGKSKTN